MKKTLCLIILTAFSLGAYAQNLAVNPNPGPTATEEDSLGYTFEQYQSRMNYFLFFDKIRG